VYSIYLVVAGSCLPALHKGTQESMVYCRHTTRFILIYTFFMPIVLWRTLHWGVFFVAPLITMLLAGIDNIGIFIENPINILPMATYCRVIHDNIILAAHDWSLDNGQVWLLPFLQIPSITRAWCQKVGFTF
jgi:predicted membrane chloride channel (bestrophin family)